MRLFVVSEQFPKWLFAQDFCSVNRDLGEGKKPSVLEQSSNYMIKLLQSKMEGVQQKVPVWCIQSQPAPLSQAIVLTWRPTCSFQRPGPITRRTNRRPAEKAKEERVRGNFPTSSPCHSAQVKPSWIWIKKWTFSLLERYTSLITVSFIISNEKVTFLYKLDSWFLFVDILFVFRVFNLFISLKIWEQCSCFWNVGCLNLQKHPWVLFFPLNMCGFFFFFLFFSFCY